MNYLKLYESFKLDKYESDQLKYDEKEKEYLSKKRELLKFKDNLKELDNNIKDGNKLDVMLEHIFDKVSENYKGELGDMYDVNNDSITEFLSAKLEGLILDMYISYEGTDREHFYGKIASIHIDRHDGWVVELEDSSLHTFYDLPSKDCYLLLQYIMSDDGVSEILNGEVFKKINK